MALASTEMAWVRIPGSKWLPAAIREGKNSRLEIAAEIQPKVALYSPLLLWKVFLPYCKWSN